MVEVANKNPDVWQIVFPDEERRKLAQAFIGKVSNLQSVIKVMTIETGKDEMKSPRIFVFTEGIETPNVTDIKTVMKFFDDVCDDKNDKALLGYTPVVTDDLFEEDHIKIPWLRKAQKNTLWERAS